MLNTLKPESNYSLGDRVVIINPSSYEIGIYLGVGTFEHTLSIDVKTGRSIGPRNLPMSKVFTYDDLLINDLVNKFGKDKRISKKF